MTKASDRVENWLNTHTGLLTAAILLCGLFLRLYRATSFYLNPDEALSYLVASQQDWHGLWESYQSAVKVAHPPLFIFVLRGILRFDRSELALRLTSVLAGTFFPWFVMLWVRQLAGAAAGLCALILLTFSPTLIGLSAEVRTYALAFFCAAASLAALQRALDGGGVIWMIWFHLCLYFAILTDYSIMFFVGAAGAYALLRLWSRPARRSVRVAWTIGQAGAFGLYLFLLATAASQWRSPQFQKDIVEGWLRGAFPQPGDHLTIFALKGFLKQFKYFMGSEYLAPFTAAVFLFGIYTLWKKRATPAIVLLILPFCLACAAAILHLFPYGTSRHTAILGILIAVGAAQGVSAITHGKILPILAAAVLLIPVWVAKSQGDPMAIPESRYRLHWMRDAMRFLLSSAAPGSVVVTDHGTDYMLAYYLNSSDYGGSSNTPYRVREAGGLRIVSAPSFQFRDDAELRESLSEVRREYRLQGPVWLAAGGFSIGVKTPPSEVRPFSEAITIFRSYGTAQVP